MSSSIEEQLERDPCRLFFLVIATVVPGFVVFLFQSQTRKTQEPPGVHRRGIRTCDAYVKLETDLLARVLGTTIPRYFEWWFAIHGTPAKLAEREDLANACHACANSHICGQLSVSWI